MPIQIIRNQVPIKLKQVLIAGIYSAIGARNGLWEVDIPPEPEANACDVEVIGPEKFYWARRPSGEDRDVEVISEAIRVAVMEQAA